MILDVLSGENDTFIDNSLFYFGKGSKRDRKIVVGKAPGNNIFLQQNISLITTPATERSYTPYQRCTIKTLSPKSASSEVRTHASEETRA